MEPIFAQTAKSNYGGVQMYIIGLTGGIASGKSTVSSMLAGLGAYIIDADKIARDVVMPGKPALLSIIDHFGKRVMLPDGNLDRKSLGTIIFENPGERSSLEHIIHPYIEKQVDNSVEQAGQLGYKAVIIDVPLLFEAGWECKVDEIWVVYAEPEVQFARLISRNQLSNEEAVNRINSQMDLGEKAKQAHVVINNTFDLETTKRQVVKEWRNICEKLDFL